MSEGHNSFTSWRYNESVKLCTAMKSGIRRRAMPGNGKEGVKGNVKKEKHVYEKSGGACLYYSDRLLFRNAAVWNAGGQIRLLFRKGLG